MVATTGVAIVVAELAGLGRLGQLGVDVWTSADGLFEDGHALVSGGTLENEPESERERQGVDFHKSWPMR